MTHFTHAIRQAALKSLSLRYLHERLIFARQRRFFSLFFIADGAWVCFWIILQVGIALHGSIIASCLGVSTDGLLDIGYVCEWTSDTTLDPDTRRMGLSEGAKTFGTCRYSSRAFPTLNSKDKGCSLCMGASGSGNRCASRKGLPASASALASSAGEGTTQD